MKKYIVNAAVILIVGGIIAASVFGPTTVSRYYDEAVFGKVLLEDKGDDVKGYKYNLSADEKLYILSNALNNRVLPQSDYYAAIRMRDNNLSNIQTQSYAFQPIYKESEYNGESRANALAALKSELETLTDAEIIPDILFDPSDDVYETSLFSAIDVLEPKKNVSVWQIEFIGSNLRHGLVNCLMDAQTFKIYGLSVRAGKPWSYYKSDYIIKLWSEYLGLSQPEEYISDNPLAEYTPYYKKYAVNGMDGDKTIVTSGFFEGIDEFFIKISK